MALSEGILPEFDQEIANTRTMLERVPNDKFDWRPHAKSWTLGGMANHIAQLLTWTNVTIEQDGFDIEPKDGEMPRPEEMTSAADVLAAFDKNAAAARASIAAASDEQLMGNWAMLKGGETIFSMPKVAVLRSFVLNHHVHHRGQLSLYLRLLDVPLPPIYGPTADEQPEW